MNIALVKTQSGSFIPATNQDNEACERIGQGELIHGKFTKMRNGAFHRKFMSMVQYVFQNQDKHKCFEDLLVEIKIRTGHYKEHIRESGEIVYIPKSISFAKMDEIEFSDFYSKAIKAIINGGIMQGTESQIMKAVEYVAVNY